MRNLIEYTSFNESYGMPINELKKYSKIGIDFDNTLYDGLNSYLIFEFIKENYKEIDFYIVTHRTPKYSESIQQQIIESFGVDMVKRGMFKNIFDTPTKVVSDYHQGIFDILMGQNHGNNDLILKGEKLKLPFLEWKGSVCKENNIPVLVDDEVDNNIIGCNKYNITLIDTYFLK